MPPGTSSSKPKSEDFIQQAAAFVVPPGHKPLNYGGGLRPVGRGIPRKRSNPSPRKQHHYKPLVGVQSDPVVWDNARPPKMVKLGRVPSPQKSQESMFPDDSCFDALPSQLLRGEVKQEESEGEKLTVAKDEQNPSGSVKEGMFSTDLADWGLPEQVVEAYRAAGITSMFPWQAACLSINSGRVLNGGNLVFSAPTSAGKTLVAEILLLKRVAETKKKGLFVLPFVALAQEKLVTLRKLLKGTDLRIGGYIGNSSPPGGLALLDVAVCTIERANSLVNRLMKDGKLHHLGVVVVDELHMVGDYSRGYLLELLLTKVIYLNRRRSSDEEESQEVNKSGIQIIGMSATLPNLPLVRKWLDADLYTTDFRPVPLYESIKLGSVLYDKTFQKLRDIPALPGVPDQDELCALCMETIRAGHSVLVFCPAKNWCENTCTTLIKLFVTVMPAGVLRAEQLNELIEQLKQTPAGLDNVLKKTIPCGVAFHHAGLTGDERDIVESGFRKGLIKVLVATTTLSSGVNLPARRVIIRSPMIYDGESKPLDPLTYYQMAGRAGRKGVDTEGESIIMCKETPDEKKAVYAIFSTAPRPLRSCLSIGTPEEPSASVQRAVLEIVVNKAARTVDHILTYLQGALFAAELDDEESCKKYTEGVIKSLEKSQFIQTEREGPGVRATQLGNAVVWSGLAPLDGKTVFDELASARSNFNLQNELHILYLVTPLNVARTIGNLNFYLFLYIWDKMPVEWQKVGNLVGVDEVVLARGLRNELSSRDYPKINRMKRFWCALMLNELVHEVSLAEVAFKYEVNKGILQSLQHGAASYSGMITTFCDELRWSNMTLLFEQFQSRLMFGVLRELVQLVRIPYLTALQARHLYEAGFPNLTKLATAECSEIAEVLRAAVPFELKVDTKSSVLLNGLEALSDVEAAELVISEARRLLEADMEAEGFIIAIKKAKPAPPVNVEKLTQRNNPQTAEYDEIRSSQIEQDQPLDEAMQKTKETTSPMSSPSKARWINQEFVKKEASVILERIERTQVQRHSQDLFDENTAISEYSSEDEEAIREKMPPIDELYSTPHVPMKYEPEFQQFKDNMTQALAKSRMTAEKTICKSQHAEFEQTPKLFTSPRGKRKADEEYQSEPEKKLFREEVKAKIQFDEVDDVDRANAGLDEVDVIPSSFPPTPEGSMTSQNGDEGIVIPPADLLQLFDIEEAPCSAEGFSGFIEQWRSQRVFSLSLGCDKLDIRVSKPRIGPPGLYSNKPTKLPDGIPLPGEKLVIVGMAVSWDGKRARYVSFLDQPRSKSNLEARGIAYIPAQQRIARVGKFLGQLRRGTVILFDMRAQIRLMGLAFGTTLVGVRCLDPQVAGWMLDMGAGASGIKDLMDEHFPLMTDVTQDVAKYKRSSSLGTAAAITAVSARTRCAVEAVASRLLLSEIHKKLDAVGLWEAFTSTEMPMARSLLALEMNGFGVSMEECRRLKIVVKEQMGLVEKKAVQCAGEELVIASPDSVGIMLFERLRLVPPPGARVESRVGGRVKVRYSTAKDILARLQDQHPLPALITQYRSLDHSRSNYIDPVMSVLTECAGLKMHRIHGFCCPFSVTGRVHMAEPSMQGIPKDFGVDQWDRMSQGGQKKGEKMAISLRTAFVPCTGCVLLSADYSQLELRVLAHLASDNQLISALSGGGDVFRNIASSWKGIGISAVDDDLRQQAKRICYGMIYGMGPRALGEQLNVPKADAERFMDSFKSAYPAVRRYLQKVVEDCRRNGFVTTIAGYRRYLPDIRDIASFEKRSSAERMAVNTTVQGSAANIAKAALVAIERELQEMYPERVWHALNEGGKIQGAYLVSQLHDEFIFEVVKEELGTVGKIVERCMRNAVQGLVCPLEVKVRVGASWGQLLPYQV